MARVLLITPPFVQLNTPYPGTAYLKGFLNKHHVSCAQADLGIEVVDELFRQAGLQQLFDAAAGDEATDSDVMFQKPMYLRAIDPVMRFLRGQDPTLARQLVSPGFLPLNLTEQEEADLEWAFGTMGVQDRAKHLATRFLSELSQFIVATVDPDFGFTRYAEHLGRCAYTFDALDNRLQEPPSFTEELMLQILERQLVEARPEWVGLSVPFPGNLLGAFRSAQWIRRHHPATNVVLGGGFANTELRGVRDPRVFDYVHAITLDDGERPFLQLLEHGLNPEAPLRRTFLRDATGQVRYCDTPSLPDFKLAETGTPDYTGLPLDKYIDAIEQTNPMHSLWSDGRWNKLTLAHGCYWAKCTFCDVSLDYIAAYEPVAARLLVDRIEELAAATGQTGFHFVDEAAPPSLLRALALELLKRGVVITWWTNIRFEARFTPGLCRLLRASGCVAVAGGLEVASDRLLALIEKGVTVDQVARVARNFTASGILVHAYLMYGFPTQTAGETVDAMERVRQLFAAGVVHSGFWHRFALTAHSPVGQDPARFGITAHVPDAPFALNDLEFDDPTGTDHGAFSDGLRIALYNWMRGEGFDLPLRRWFDHPTPKPRVARDWIERVLDAPEAAASPHAQLVYLGAPLVRRGPVWVTQGMEAFVEWAMEDGEAGIWSERLASVQPGARKTSVASAEWLAHPFAQALLSAGLLVTA